MGSRKAIKYRIDEKTGCHICTSHSLDTRGYPKRKRNGITERLHRVVYATYFGAIPTGMVVMHTCDNRRCVNPKHLKLGTQKENVQDAGSKGAMSRRGAVNGRAKLCEDDVEYIRDNYKDGAYLTIPFLASMFEVSVSTIKRVVHGYAGGWRHVP